MFLTTPPNGIRDSYASLAYTLGAASALLRYEEFRSDTGLLADPTRSSAPGELRGRRRQRRLTR